MSENDNESIFEFPCEIEIKAMGLTHENLESHVVEIVRRHAGELREGAVRSRPSKAGKYTSISVTILATSKKQLDSIYMELHKSETILMTL
jgi:putative lipoic acid-binding regulatory protein